MDVIIRLIVSALRTVPGIDAVVLGGSHATGHATKDSDLDIGVYYGLIQPLDWAALNHVVQMIDDDHRAHLVSDPGGWGPWVNAGAWLRINGQPVDIILRDTTRVIHVISACKNGEIEAHYHPGHPHAFINVMYMGELSVCNVLWDATHEIASLKRQVESYSDAVQQGIYRAFRFEAQFSTHLAIKNIHRHDAYYVTAHLVRAISSLNQILFALNRHYCLNEKQAVSRAGLFEKTPNQYHQRVDALLADVWQNPAQACADMQDLIDEVEQLIHREGS